MPYPKLTGPCGYFIRRVSPILFIQNGKVHHDKREAENSTVDQSAIPFSQDNPTPRATARSRREAFGAEHLAVEFLLTKRLCENDGKDGLGLHHLNRRPIAVAY